MLQSAFRPSCMKRASVFWVTKENQGRQGVCEGDERCGRSKEVNTSELIAKRLGLGLLCWGFKGVQEEIPRERTSLLKTGQWHFQEDYAPVPNSILVTDYLSKMGIKTVRQPPYCPDLSSCDFWLFPKLRGCCHETSEELKEAMKKVIDTLTQEVFYGAFQKLFERYNKCIATGGDYFEGTRVSCVYYQ